MIWTAGLTVTARFCEALTAPAASVTVTEKLKGVAELTTGAVPDSVPDDERLSHVGRPLACHVKGVVPLLSAKVWLYGPPDIPAGSDVVVTEGAGLIVRANVLVVEDDRMSVTRTVKLTGPAAVGVPLSTPVLVMVSQSGRVVPLSAKVSGAVPPATASVCVYGRPTVHVGKGEADVRVGNGFTVTLKALLPVSRTLSVTVTLKL